MSSTSRRNFLSGAAAAAAACAAGCTQTQAPASPPATPPAPPGSAAPLPIDQQVAFDYMGLPSFLDPTLDNQPYVAMLLFGLVCADVSGQELLLPNTTGLGTIVPVHKGRLWTQSEWLPSGAAKDGEEIVGSLKLSYWNLDGLAITMAPTDSSGNVLVPAPGILAHRNSPTHPWTDMKWVRSVTGVTGLNFIPAAKRDDTSLVSARVALPGGTITAVPPHSKLGRNVEWKVTPTSGPPIIGSTTDAMLWHRGFPASTTGVKLSLRKRSDGSVRDIVLTPKNGQLSAVVTHASAMSMGGLLSDTKAFAQLLQGGSVSSYPSGVAFRNFDSGQSSSDDGHCECGV